MRGTHGWAEVSRERKREIIDAIVANRPTRGPVHAELDLTDRCNVACYFCNQQDLRTKESIPLPKLTDLIDELVEGGLKSVRLSGGGDPLFHRDILPTMDYLAKSGVVIDNVTTNGVALNAEVARRLVDGKAREVIFSLNAVDAADYARMMKVKPALFDKVLENVRNLVAMRGDSMYPSVVIQFLIDKVNFRRMPEMYDLGRSLNPDRIAINAVLDIPLERIDHDVLLAPSDRHEAEPLFEEILRRDRDANLLQMSFAVAEWDESLSNARQKLAVESHNQLPIAKSFKIENGGCFFGWYSAAITGNGDIRPCCLLLNPTIKPLGNVNDGKFADHWNGPEFAKMRSEMREVLLMKSRIPWSPKRFEVLPYQCVDAYACYLKNMYFRPDEEFYTELGEALDTMRKKEIRLLFGTNQERKRAIELFVQEHPRVKTAWDWFRESSRPMRIFLKSKLGLNVTDAV